MIIVFNLNVMIIHELNNWNGYYTIITLFYYDKQNKVMNY